MIYCAVCGSRVGVTGPCGTCKRNERCANQVLQGLVAFIGSGHITRGHFPKTLTELSDDCCEYVAALSRVRV
jgi:hypothetical protein